MLPTIRRTVDTPFAALRELDRAVGQMWGDLGDNAAAGTFAVDIHERGDQLVVEADLPGFKKDQIDISVEQGVLTIEAERQTPEPTGEGNGNKRQHVAERRYSRVSRRFSLPSAYDTQGIDATLTDGVLTVKLQKREESKPRKVEVK